MNLHFNEERLNLKERALDSHKGSYGHVVIIGAGHHAYVGAVCLAASAALRSGAGRVSIIVHPKAFPLMHAPIEAMCYAEAFAAMNIAPTVMVLGPGLTQSIWARRQFECVINLNIPVVLDADGLHLLANSQFRVPDHWVLTPHPGEASALLGITTAEVQADRKLAIQKIHQKWGGVVVLKGHGTLVYQGDMIYHCAQGNPGMASAGMGDVLAGLIGGLIAQGLCALDAAKLGVITHALAADQQAARLGQRGMLASDVIHEFRMLLN